MLCIVVNYCQVVKKPTTVPGPEFDNYMYALYFVVVTLNASDVVVLSYKIKELTG